MNLFGLEIRKAKTPPIRFLGDLVKVNLSPGDVCVLMCRDSIGQDELLRLSDEWRSRVGDDITLIVLGAGMKLGVLSPPQSAAIHERLTDETAVAEAIAS